MNIAEVRRDETTETPHNWRLEQGSQATMQYCHCLLYWPGLIHVATEGDAMFHSWWQKIKQHRVTIIIFAIILVVAIALIIVGYRFDWTGFNGNNTPGKTLWDWLQLLGVLAIPIVVGFGTAFFTRQQAKTSEANAENQQQEELLRTYFDKISELVLNSEFSTNRNVESIVRARTLAALHILNATRKGIVLQFLHDLNLLQHVKSYFYLST